ncbi:hypothetical protein RxyAA322_26680 [Rubrobacter xylanophilus]|uniref:Uncharacterized protein n=1 Tax=Rubrobacter xylanophilus TaxID=49319 RepID=A0A510HLN7_9ACTN|nr:hypothetical protein RxyAA322_26680 [Rubrobacter xylanophilus]
MPATTETRSFSPGSSAARSAMEAPTETPASPTPPESRAARRDTSTVASTVDGEISPLLSPGTSGT